MSGEYPDSEWVKVEAAEIENAERAGETWVTTKAIETNKSLATDLMAQVSYIIPRMRKELKDALDELEEARKTVVSNNKELFAGFKNMPTKEDMSDIRKWGSEYKE